MRTSTTFLASALAIVATIAGCNTAPQTTADKANIEIQASAALAQAQNATPGLKPHIQGAKAVAVFPEIDKGGLILGGAYGKGVFYENGVATGYCDVSQGTIGAQIGGQSYTEILIFNSDLAVTQFKNQEFAFTGQATAVAADKGAGINVKYRNGVAVITVDEHGLMGEAAVGGQKFTFQPKAR